MTPETSDHNDGKMKDGSETDGRRKATDNSGKRSASESSRRESQSSQVNVIKTLTGTTSPIVEQAASILEQEIAAGIIAAKRIEERFVNVSEVRSGRSDEVMKRFRRDSHDVVDIVVDLINVATRSLASLAEGSVTVHHAEPEKGGLGSLGGIPALSAPGTVRSGHSVEMPLALENDGEAPTDRLRLHCADLINASGDLIAASHITFTPASLVIDPHSSERVVVTVAVPAGTPPGIYSGLIQATSLKQLRAMLSVEVE